MVEPFVGSIQYFAFSYAPAGWLPCDGRLINIQQYQALYSLISNLYGSGTSTTFQLPDFRGRVISGANSLTAGPYKLGTQAGAESATIGLQSLPQHTHTMSGSFSIEATASTGGVASPANSIPAQLPSSPVPYLYSSKMSSPLQYLGGPLSITVASTGVATPVDIRSPYQALNCCIATSGLYPPRP